MSGTRIYRNWASMLARCYNPNNPGYPKYCHRGYEPWKSFERFYADVSVLPDFGRPERSLDRIDNSAPYGPTNCRWATRSEQVRNRNLSKKKRTLGNIRLYSSRMIKRAARHTVLAERQQFAAALARAKRSNGHHQPEEATMVKRGREALFKQREEDVTAITPSLERQQWLERAVEALRERFAGVGYTVPQKIRVSIGWPKRAASCGAIGECWSTEASSDAHAELFVSPELTVSGRILDVLAHELTHATVGTAAGHQKPFKQCALKIGLQGPMRSTTGGPEFMTWAETLFKRIGLYPAGFLTDSPKQGTRMRKCECSICGYTARVARKWLALAGPPICPTDRVAMIEREGLVPTPAPAPKNAPAAAPVPSAACLK